MLPRRPADIVVFSVKLLVFSTQFLVFDTEFLVFNAKFLVLFLFKIPRFHSQATRGQTHLQNP